MKQEVSDDPQHYYELGDLFVDVQNYTDALEQYRKAIQLKPDYIEALLKSGDCLYMLKNYQQATEPFKAVVEIDPQNMEAYGKLSHLYGLLGNIEMQQFYDAKSRGE